MTNTGANFASIPTPDESFLRILLLYNIKRLNVIASSTLIPIEDCYNQLIITNGNNMLNQEDIEKLEQLFRKITSQIKYYIEEGYTINFCKDINKGCVPITPKTFTINYNKVFTPESTTPLKAPLILDLKEGLCTRKNISSLENYILNDSITTVLIKLRDEVKRKSLKVADALGDLESKWWPTQAQILMDLAELQTKFGIYLVNPTLVQTSRAYK